MTSLIESELGRKVTGDPVDHAAQVAVVGSEPVHQVSPLSPHKVPHDGQANRILSDELQDAKVVLRANILLLLSILQVPI